jgi:hypothetical protein
MLLSNHVEYALQLAVHPVHSIGGGRGQSVQKCHRRSHVLASPGKGQTRRPIMVNGSGDGLGPSSGLGKVDGFGPLRP